jgi:hypothetical protein
MFGLLAGWRESNPEVVRKISEFADREIEVALVAGDGRQRR